MQSADPAAALRACSDLRARDIPQHERKNGMVKVKICGITNWSDARHAVEAGADFLGFNFYPKSPRYIAPAVARRIVQRLPENVASVGVFVNEPEREMLAIARRVGLDYVQLHGDEQRKQCRACGAAFA